MRRSVNNWYLSNSATIFQSMFYMVTFLLETVQAILRLQLLIYFGYSSFTLMRLAMAVIRFQPWLRGRLHCGTATRASWQDQYGSLLPVFTRQLRYCALWAWSAKVFIAVLGLKDHPSGWINCCRDPWWPLSWIGEWRSQIRFYASFGYNPLKMRHLHYDRSVY